MCGGVCVLGCGDVIALLVQCTSIINLSSKILILLHLELTVCHNKKTKFKILAAMCG